MQSEQKLQLSLYSGIALIVISILFLGQEQESLAFGTRALMAIGVPALFYLLGGLVIRYLRAPLAGPGIIATGGWLIVVGLVHLWDQQDMPDLIRPYYWTVASLLGAAIITMTAYNVRTWLLIPLVPVMQAVALWSAFNSVELNVQWWSALTFLLVLAWWELSGPSEDWRVICRVSGGLMSVFLLIFAYWLPAPTNQTMLTTWSAGALLVTYLGIRYRLASLGPLALTMLTGAAAWGLSPGWWPLAWLGIAVGTLIFIEGLARHNPDANIFALDASIALATILTGIAALASIALPILGVAVNVWLAILVLFISAILLGWIGWRGGISTAVHASLWLLAAGWGQIYLNGVEDPTGFGLWLSLLAVVALLAERILTSMRKQKRKMMYSIKETVARWPLADLSIGLTLITVIWFAMNVTALSPLMLALTLLVVIGIWMVAGLIYRLPLLIHAALWIAPLPYALLLLVLVPGLRSVSMMALAWQMLGVFFVLIGHIVPKYRPAMLAPFFVAGYALLAFGLTLTMANPVLVLWALTMVIIVSFGTGVAVIMDAHPAWSALIAWLIPPENRPYAFRHVHNSFLFLTAWLSVIWLQLMLTYANFPVAQQGIIMVLLSSAWIIAGRFLERFPRLVGWPVYGAGWLMWLIGLLQVFFAPTEAIIAAIFGLVLSGEAIQRSREVHWMPVFIGQLVFSSLQIAWLFELPAQTILIALGAALTIMGIWVDKPGTKLGRLVMLTGGLVLLLNWLILLNLAATLAVLVVALAALAHYRRWEWLAVIYALMGLLYAALHVSLTWPVLMTLAVLQLAAATLLINRLRPRGYRGLESLVVAGDWAGPFLWAGFLTLGLAVIQALGAASAPYELVGPALVLAAILGVFAVLWRIPSLPSVSVVLIVFALLLDLSRFSDIPYRQLGEFLAVRGLLMVALALGGKMLVFYAVNQPRHFARMRVLVWWLRPIRKVSTFLAFLGLPVVWMAYGVYEAHPFWMVAAWVMSYALLLLIYTMTARVKWLVASIGMMWLGWAAMLAAIDLQHVQAYTLFYGLSLLVLARQVRDFDEYPLEFAGVCVLIYGAGISVVNGGVMSPASVWAALLILALLVYGYRDGRTIPFFGPLLIIFIGTIGAIIYVNPWLLPLVAGVLLIGGVLLLETRRDWVESHLATWSHLLRQWQ